MVPLSVLILVVVGVGALAIAASAALAEQARRRAVGRAAGAVLADESGPSLLVDRPGDGDAPVEQLVLAIGRVWKPDEQTEGKLVHAGFDGPSAPLVYGAIRVASVVAVPLLATVLISAPTPSVRLLVFGAAGLAGYILPVYLLERAVRLRRQRILRSLPDCMDLLVLCVEAGLGFDAAVLRVAKEMRTTHPDIAGQLLLVNRQVNAGVSREEALRAAYARTGVEELRVLVQHLIQSERLGTSIAQVLRVYGQTLRRKRKQLAERKAATAPLKMTIPMAALILPALFVVILGPAVMQISKLFHPGR